MENTGRTAFEGVTNILRFNWHFFAGALVSVVLLLVLRVFITAGWVVTCIHIAAFFTLLTTAVSLAVSFYVYDCSDLYTLKWLDAVSVRSNARLVNIHAGFDETSALLAAKYPQAALTVFDFYNASKHTEVSIERARKARVAYPGTQKIQTDAIPLPDDSADNIFLILAAHEITDQRERIAFFADLRRILNKNGRIMVVEHLRDWPNFLAYNIGYIHFYSKLTWKHAFSGAGLTIEKAFPVTPFITVFLLQNNGITP